MKNEYVKKIPIGVNVIPETFHYFKAGAKLFNVNLSQFLNMVIHKRADEGFVYCDVDPKFGDVSNKTKQTILYVSEEQRALIQEWADREKCTLTSIIRCLMDITVKKMIAYDKEMRDENGCLREQYENILKEKIFDAFDRHGVSISAIIDRHLVDFKDQSVRKLVKEYDSTTPNLFNYRIQLTDKQCKRIESIATRQKIDIESVKSAFELVLLSSLVTQNSKFCHVSKSQFVQLKHIGQKIGFTPSRMLEDYVGLLLEEKYHTPNLSPDVELLRVNVVLTDKTVLIIEQYCAEHRIKFAEAVRTLTNCIYNYFEQEGVHTPVQYVF